MRRNNRALYRTARGILLDDADAEDAVQEAYLKAYRAMDRFHGESKLTTWLTRIVINEALQKLRNRKQEAGTVSLENVVDLEMHIDIANEGKSSPVGPETAAMRAQTRKLLEHKIDQLPSAFRTVFILRALEEMSVEETASCIGITEATVRTRFFRAKSLLRESLAGNGSGFEMRLLLRASAATGSSAPSLNASGACAPIAKSHTSNREVITVIPGIKAHYLSTI
jgi:RNA polymerase sigma-70 factor (ECF subfamily)